MTDHVNVDLACNDDHGRFSGVVTMVEFSADGHHIGLAYGPDGYRDVGLTDSALVVAGVPYLVLERASWVGNRCWERAVLSLDDARKLMRRLFADGWDLDEWTEGSPFQDVIREAGHNV